MANQSKIQSVHIFTSFTGSRVSCVIDYSSGSTRYFWNRIPETAKKFLCSSRAVLRSRTFSPVCAEIASHFYDIELFDSSLGALPPVRFEIYKPCNIPAEEAPAEEAPAEEAPAEEAPEFIVRYFNHFEWVTLRKNKNSSICRFSSLSSALKAVKCLCDNGLKCRVYKGISYNIKALVMCYNPRDQNKK